MLDILSDRILLRQTISKMSKYTIVMIRHGESEWNMVSDKNVETTIAL